MTVRILVREGIWLIVSTVLAVVLWLRVVADHNQWLSVVQEHWRGTLTSPLPPAPGVELLIAYAAALYAGFAVFRYGTRSLGWPKRWWPLSVH
jgi:hypothetical protein